MTAQGGVRQDFLHGRAYNIMHTLTYTSDFNFVTPCTWLPLWANIFFEWPQWSRKKNPTDTVGNKQIFLFIIGLNQSESLSLYKREIRRLFLC